MTTIIVAALALALIQYWIIPLSTKLDKLPYLMGTRDQPLELSIMQARIERAANNLKESMVPFVTLALLSMIKNVYLTQVAMLWLGLRVVYVPCYLFGINPVRTFVWIASLGCLVYMAYMLI